MSRWGKVDFKALERLQKKMDRWQKIELEQFCVDCAKELAARLIARAIRLTPVDTGELRRSWTLDNQYIHVARKGHEYECEIINSMEYASYVEYGHRTRGHDGWVHGYFMLTKAEMGVESIAPKLLEKRLQEKLGEIFGDQ